MYHLYSTMLEIDGGNQQNILISAQYLAAISSTIVAPTNVTVEKTGAFHEQAPLELFSVLFTSLPFVH
jgi:hypothetical protein